MMPGKTNAEKENITRPRGCLPACEGLSFFVEGKARAKARKERKESPVETNTPQQS